MEDEVSCGDCSLSKRVPEGDFVWDSPPLQWQGVHLANNDRPLHYKENLVDSQSNCIFCRIINREIPGHFVYQDDSIVAFMDIGPFREGHLLVVPRQHVPEFQDLDDALYSRLMQVVKRLSVAAKAATGAPRIGLLVMGFEVPHTHVHVIPMQESADILARACNDTPPIKPSGDDLVVMASRIAAALNE